MRRLTITLSALLLAVIAILLSTCTCVGAIRRVADSTSILPTQQAKDLLSQCSPGTVCGHTEGEVVNSIEDYGTHTIGYVEYSDQGWEFDAGVQRQALIRRLRVDIGKPESADVSTINVVFVHGWHHSAHHDNCNVKEFRAILHQLNADFQQSAAGVKTPLHIRFNCVYVALSMRSLFKPIFLRSMLQWGRHAPVNKAAALQW